MKEDEMGRLYSTNGKWEMRINYWSGDRKERNKRHRSKWEDNIKMNFKETGCAGVHWIELPQDRFH
jgi:hypothetical protein